jgi:hypothetical protein
MAKELFGATKTQFGDTLKICNVNEIVNTQFFGSSAAAFSTLVRSVSDTCGPASSTRTERLTLTHLKPWDGVTRAGKSVILATGITPETTFNLDGKSIHEFSALKSHYSPFEFRS